MLFDYDDTNINSVLNYAKKIEDLTFRDILVECKKYLAVAENGNKMNRPLEFINSLKNDKLLTSENSKGQLGNIIEKFYFGYEPNSNQNADLDKIGVEIKQTPIDIKKDGTLTAGERLVITMISYTDPVEDDFYKSHVYEKIKNILLVQYIRDKSKNRLDNRIKYVNLFTPPPEDLEIIINDYKVITQKIKEGRAHELSESDTYYLGACTKGSTAQNSWREQYYGSHIPAKKRAFCLKNSYMTHVLQDYVLTHKLENESIIKNIDELKHLSFEQIIINKINNYKNKTDEELCSLFDREYNNNKSQWIDLSYRMLGIKGNHAEEFEKANVKVKAIRIEANGKNKESISFPTFKYKELANESWDTSFIHEYFSTTKFLFVIFKSNGKTYNLLCAQMCNMPYNDLEETVKNGWLSIQEKIITGVAFTKTSNCIKNDLPKKSDNPIIHIRPHAQKAAFKLNSGYSQGNINRDANELPDGQWMTTHSFWINNDYILKQLKYK